MSGDAPGGARVSGLSLEPPAMNGQIDDLRVCAGSSRAKEGKSGHNVCNSHLRHGCNTVGFWLMNQVDRYSTRPQNRWMRRVIAAIGGAGAIAFAMPGAAGADPVPPPPSPAAPAPGVPAPAPAPGNPPAVPDAAPGPRPGSASRWSCPGATGRRPARGSTGGGPQCSGPATGRPERTSTRADRQSGRWIQLCPSGRLGRIRRDSPGLRFGVAQQDFGCTDPWSATAGRQRHSRRARQVGPEAVRQR